MEVLMQVDLARINDHAFVASYLALFIQTNEASAFRPDLIRSVAVDGVDVAFNLYASFTIGEYIARYNRQQHLHTII